jgi:hypothetical protein
VVARQARGAGGRKKGKVVAGVVQFDEHRLHDGLPQDVWHGPCYRTVSPAFREALRLPRARPMLRRVTCWYCCRSRFPVAISESTHGGVFPVTVVDGPLIHKASAPAQYCSYTTPQTEDLFHVAGFVTDEGPNTRQAVLLAWSWARLVAPSVADQLELDCKNASGLASLGVLLTTGTPWRSVSGPSCAATVALVFLVHYVPAWASSTGRPRRARST